MTDETHPSAARSSPQPLPEGVRERAASYLAKVVRELGPSMSPGALAATIERNPDLIDAKIIALLAHPQGGVEEGIEGRPELPCADAQERSPETVLIPKEPAEATLAAMRDAFHERTSLGALRAYRAIISEATQ